MKVKLGDDVDDGRIFFLVWFFRLSNVRKKKRSRERPRMRRIERVRDGNVAAKERERVRVE